MKNKATPHGYMTVGEMAKKMNVTVRTLQYYDKEGVLLPSSVSDGGRRLYTHKDMIRMHQIQSMRHLGFSLADIKTKLPSINTPEEVSKVLTEQANGICEQIDSLKDVLESIEKLNTEVLQMNDVDWTKYAMITTILQSKSDSYWLTKYFSDDMSQHFHCHFEQEEEEKALKRLKKLTGRAAALQKKGFKPEDGQSQALAKDWWAFVMDVTDGNMSLVPELFEFGDNISEGEWQDKYAFDKAFIGKALEIYFERSGNNPFKVHEEKKETLV